jgi:hypothetical protein
MNLHDELESLAQWAPPGVNPEPLLRRARQIKTRRAIGIPAVAVLIVLVIVVPQWPRIGLSPADRPVTLTFRVTSSADASALERTRVVLERRASALGLRYPHASILDDHTLVLETTRPRDEATLAALYAPGRFEARLVLKTFSMQFQVPTSLPQQPSPGAPASTLDGVIAKLGNAYQAALAVKQADPADYSLLQAFRWLTPEEVSLLPATVQFNVPSISCEQLNGRKGFVPAANAVITVCASDVDKMLLDPAILTGPDIAYTEVVPQLDRGYGLSVRFTPSSNPRWTAMTRSAASGEGCDPGQGPQCRIAFLIDSRVISYPTIREPIAGPLYTERLDSARAWAAQIGPLELPVKLEPVD